MSVSMQARIQLHVGASMCTSTQMKMENFLFELLQSGHKIVCRLFVSLYHFVALCYVRLALFTSNKIIINQSYSIEIKHHEIDNCSIQDNKQTQRILRMTFFLSSSVRSFLFPQPVNQSFVHSFASIYLMYFCKLCTVLVFNAIECVVFYLVRKTKRRIK